MKPNPDSQIRRIHRAFALFLAALASISSARSHAKAPSCDLPGDLLPPPTGTYHFAGDLRVPGGSVIIRDLALSLPSSSQAPPAAGTSATHTCNMQASGRFSTNNGSTFTSFSATANVTTFTSAHALGEPYDTEMLAMTFTLPGGVMVRESPTRASTGKTSLRVLPDGGWRIDSFFDVFTDISINSGSTWEPVTDATPCPMYGSPGELATASPNLPPSASVCRNERPIRFPSAAGGCILRNLTISDPTNPLPPPPPGGSQNVSTQITLSGEMSLNNGATFTAFSTVVSSTPRFTSYLDSGSTRYFDTEMLQFDISGGTIPGGILIRESPTLQSKGRTSLRTMSTGGYRIGSFFDIFTEISFDGGVNWSPASTGACRFYQDRYAREAYFRTNCFPQAGRYACDEEQDTGFGDTGVVLRRVGLQPVSRARELPAAGTAETLQFDGQIECEVSVDRGATFTRVLVDATGVAMIGAYEWSHGDTHERPMESVSLNFTCPGSTTVMVRESPTRASTGRHAVQSTPDGHFMISSFFDIFTEISLDGGSTWKPADAPITCSLLPYLEAENVFKCSHLPPRDGSYEARKYADPVVFTSTALVRNLKLGKFPTSAAPPEHCANPRSLDLTTEGELELSLNGGATWDSYRFTGTVTIRITPRDAIGEGASDTLVFDTEMLSLSLSGGTLPSSIRLRESPTRQSLGQARIMEEEGIYYYFQIDSFFDVFTELSLDDGTSWNPAQNSCQLELHAKPEGPTPRSNWLPLAVQYRETAFNFAIPYGQQASISSFSVDCSSLLCTVAGNRAPAPAPGSSLTRTMTAPVSCDVSLDEGLTTHRATGTATVECRYFDPTNDGGWSAMTGEVLQFDVSLTGAGLPAGIMLRESPSKASLGRCASLPDGPIFHIDSFFDVFTELSVDGGSNWTPACKTLHLVALPEGGSGLVTAAAGRILSGTFKGGPGMLTLRTATGQHIKDAKLFVRKQGTEQHDYLAPLPSPGTITPVSTNATLQLDYSPDGITYTRVEAPVFYYYEMENIMISSFQWSCTNDMTVFDASGGSFPDGMMLREKRRPGRESPTLASLGRTTCTELTGGQFHINSFFDVFTELSVDGGRTWHEFDLPLHFELEAPQVESVGDITHWQPAGRLQLPPGDPDFDLLYLDGSRCSFFDIFTEFAGPGSLPDLGQTSSMATQASVRLSLDPSTGPPVDVTCPATIITNITRNQPESGDGTSTFDTEMLMLQLSGLPSGILVRESPTRASLGRTTIRSSGSGGGTGKSNFAIDSFFDIFTEISIDGGAIWHPAEVAIKVVHGAPDIVVLSGSDPVNSVSCAPTLTGSTSLHTLTIRNQGNAPLFISSLTINGDNPSDFITNAPPTELLAPGSGFPVYLEFTPTTPGIKSAVLHIASSDPEQPTVDIPLTGRAFDPNADDDNDGVTNEQEIGSLASFGFNPAVPDAGGLDILRDAGFYRASDMHSLALGRPVLQRDPGSGNFHLSLGLLRSPSLTDWSPMLLYSPTYSPATGRIDIEFPPAPGTHAEFYRVFGEPPAP